MVGRRCGRPGTRGDSDSGTGTTRSWAGGRGHLTGGGHVLRGQLGIQLDVVQPDLGRAAGLALVLHSCRDVVASAPATSLTAPATCVSPQRVSPSLFMPACRHFLSRQAWHWLRCALSTGHSPVPAWHLWERWYLTAVPGVAPVPGRALTWVTYPGGALSLLGVLSPCNGFPPPQGATLLGTLSPVGALSQ